MGQQGGWRAIPSELLVPAVMMGLVRPLVVFVGGARANARAAYIIEAAQTILLLCGLLELRRRLTGPAARWIAAAAALQAVAVLELLVLELAAHLEIDHDELLALAPTFHVWLAAAMAVLLSTAARTWRSPLGPLLVATAVLASPPLFLYRAIFAATGLYYAGLALVLALLAHTALQLAIYARLGAATAPAPDFTRAERAARRAARWQRARLAAVAI